MTSAIGMHSLLNIVREKNHSLQSFKLEKTSYLITLTPPPPKKKKKKTTTKQNNNQKESVYWSYRKNIEIFYIVKFGEFVRN